MAISLPPPTTPELGSAVELRAEATAAAQSAVTVDLLGYHFIVFGAPEVKADDIRKAIGATSDLSDAVRAVGYVYYLAGYPAARITYALVDKDLYVHVDLGSISKLTAPASLQPFFDDLIGQKPLTATHLERDRALADPFSERAGENYSPILRSVDGESIFDLGPPQPGRDKTQLRGEFSDYGNRYSGRYLFDGTIRHSFGTGDELSGTGITSVGNFGEPDAQPYHEGDANWSRITSVGLFNLQGRYATYGQLFQGLKFDGYLADAGVSWLYPLYADFLRRLNLQITVDYRDQVLQYSPTDQKLLTETYASAEASTGYVERQQFGTQLIEWQGGVALRHGLGAISGQLTQAKLDYFLLRPTGSVRYTPVPHWSFALEGSGQWSPDTVPQQEQWVIGGPATLHAFIAGAGVGDYGGTARLSGQWRGLDLKDFTIRPTLYLEYGFTGRTHEQPGSGTVEAGDVAGAIDLSYRKWFDASFSMAKDLMAVGKQNSGDHLSPTYYYFRVALTY